MVTIEIDKSTGKGCAWSITSKTIATRLIADGIVGQPIYRMPRKDTYDTVFAINSTGYCVRLSQKMVQELAQVPVWTPSFIEASIWQQAVKKFQPYQPLDVCVERFLLPYMDEYLQNIPEAELISITREFLLENGVVNCPIRQRAGKTYYFNEDEVYSLDKESQLFPYQGRVRFNMFIVRGSGFNMNVWNKAASRFEAGMTLEQCIGIFLQTELTRNTQQEPTPLDRLVQHISPPVFEREPENQNNSTFDRIRITVGLSRYLFSSWEDLKREVETYRPEIYQRVVQKLENDRQFKRYGVPINFIKLSDVTLLLDYSLEFIFELKEPKSSSVTVEK